MRGKPRCVCRLPVLLQQVPPCQPGRPACQESHVGNLVSAFTIFVEDACKLVLPPISGCHVVSQSPQSTIENVSNAEMLLYQAWHLHGTICLHCDDTACLALCLHAPTCAEYMSIMPL